VQLVAVTAQVEHGLVHLEQVLLVVKNMPYLQS